MNIKWFITSCVALFCMACEHAMDLKMENISREVHFEILTSSLSRSGKDIFAVGDSIGIYAVKRMKDGKQAFPAQTGNQAHNAKWVKTEEGWLPATPWDKVLWSQDDSPLDFYAYYPYQRQASNPLAINLGVNPDQGSPELVGQSDVLRAINVQGLTEGEVELQFEHVFSLLEIKLSGDKILSGSPVKVSASEVVTNVLFDLGTGTWTPLKTGNVTARCVDAGQMLYQVVLPSQNIEAGKAFLQCEIEGGIYMYRSSGIELEPACLQKFEIEVK